MPDNAFLSMNFNLVQNNSNWDMRRRNQALVLPGTWVIITID